MLRRLRHFGGDVRGVSAVEFALIAPALIAFYFGIAEFTQAVMADRRVINVGSSIGDLASQDKSITNAEMTDIFALGQTVMSPFSTTSLTMRVSQITANASNVKTIAWSDGSGMTARTVGSSYSPPAGLIAANESLIMAEVNYSYTSPVGYFIPTPKAFSKTFYLRPRLSTTISRVP
jgi:Flp pilus assembly protein TadG